MSKNFYVKNESLENRFLVVQNESTLAKNLCKKVEEVIDNNKTYTDQEKKFCKDKFYLALDLLFFLVKGQNKKRYDGFYLDHILRVTNRLVKDFQVRDFELIISGLLHDSVEDQPDKLSRLIKPETKVVKRTDALIFLKNEFGPRIQKTVEGLSNPEIIKEIKEPVIKNEIYKEHVKKAIKDSDVFLVKLADFHDNALNLSPIKDLEYRLKLSKKYLPVMDVFLERIDYSSDVFSKEERERIISLFTSKAEETKRFCLEFGFK